MWTNPLMLPGAPGEVLVAVSLQPGTIITAGRAKLNRRRKGRCFITYDVKVNDIITLSAQESYKKEEIRG